MNEMRINDYNITHVKKVTFRKVSRDGVINSTCTFKLTIKTEKGMETVLIYGNSRETGVLLIYLSIFRKVAILH